MDTNHSCQLSLTVVVNLPRNSMISTCTYIIQEWANAIAKPRSLHVAYRTAQELLLRPFFTWSTTVMAIMAMKRRFPAIPLKIFSSSGFRALNSLNTCRRQDCGLCLTPPHQLYVFLSQTRAEVNHSPDREQTCWIWRYFSAFQHALGCHVPTVEGSGPWKWE